MKAITIHQPWATLIALGEKRFETRGWKTNYRGPIAIHASKQLLYDYRLPKLSGRLWELGLRKEEDFPLGCVIAIADLVECWPVRAHIGKEVHLFFPRSGRSRFLDKEGTEVAFGDFTPGRYAWELANVQCIEPVPVKGQQGLWNWEGNV
ncbi:PUA-like domain-containing protein [Paenibacillus sp. 32O-W]|uniref:ASCH domain-containing protein n=1 Tax=Paenibacillus sp. 32O-W TaxID=1695218 RepID=UPI0007211BFD|nr:ASCH domain-containing protein [Paenibacillus sp. 32O-W]ALS27177.1 PUA-like domain-containing protein [Paenibacillus sp. 32O-W]